MERDFSYYEEKYAEYLNSLSEKKRLAHRIAFEVLGTSYQLPYTMDYLEYQKNAASATVAAAATPTATSPAPAAPTSPAPATQSQEEKPPPKKVIRRIKRKNIKRKKKGNAD
jgi:hypothetical protein